MANSAMLLDLTLSDLEGQSIGYILAPILHKIGSSSGKFSWMTFIFEIGLP